jgi:hypothetical protein
MQFTAAGAFLQLDKWDDRVFPAAGWGGGIGAELQQAFFQGGVSEDVLWDGSDNLRLDGDNALWIWAHGNKKRDAIAAGKNESLSPITLAHALRRISKQSDGHVVVWSCWGGHPGGFAETLARFMLNNGHDRLHFWGANCVTGSLQQTDEKQWADVFVYADGSSRLVGLDRGNTSLTGVDYGSRRAVRSDMSGFGPGLQTPLFRTGTMV